MSSLLALLALLSSAAAAPAATSTCSSIAYGYLNADTYVYSDPLSLVNNTLTFAPALYDAMPPIQFQTCSPNHEGYSNVDTGVNGTYAGHLYIPTLDLCLGVADTNSVQPYTVTATSCPYTDNSAQDAFNWVMKNQTIYWGGKTHASGSPIQGGDSCPDLGLFGYQGNDVAIPSVIGTTPLICGSWADVYGFIILPIGYTR
ncbi:hypothetical protein SERLA73DRAFT_167127 [Serpula lacrymans var. lacrymans S7.3]|uniref:Uncharacterized protein n=2 Tax=Serpula lacrymans var. lacrymans TaxID=341189 RepID=F8PT84_SERL3|nr:uncharacterized protein SERLADRAFT_447717 [Serpula lacrymans var. lacrymans S7.9]EGO00914.1 hypothetical protein SERLA73DRAFT_167127 [Serpula lacrymans var. lacrymans S7.3]EGO26532.1 hypothetical protein SERLADRAFT_447717 [Serpula lacrymans var. lacrymans S7.9]